VTVLTGFDRAQSSVTAMKVTGKLVTFYACTKLPQICIGPNPLAVLYYTVSKKPDRYD